MPAGPRERGIAVPVLGVKARTRIQQELEGLLCSAGGCTVRWNLSPGTAVAHESTGLYPDLGHAVRTSPSGQQEFDYLGVGGVDRHFPQQPVAIRETTRESAAPNGYFVKWGWARFGGAWPAVAGRGFTTTHRRCVEVCLHDTTWLGVAERIFE